MRWILFFILILITTLSEAQRLSKKSTEERIQELENRIQELYSRQVEGSGRVTTFLNNNFSLGGFYDGAITSVSGPDTETQFSASSNIFGLNFSTDFSDSLDFVAQFITGLSYPLVNAHNNPSLTPSSRQYLGFGIGSLITQAYLEYENSPAFRIQTGLGYIPFGKSMQQREFVLFRRRGGPQLANPTGSTAIALAFPLWMGLHASGSIDQKKFRWGYNAYTFSPQSNPKTLGMGTRLWMRPIEGLFLGTSLQSGQNSNSTYWTYGFDVDYSIRQFGITAEYARNLDSTDDSTPESYYVEPYYTFTGGSWVIYGVIDYLSQPNLVEGAGIDNGFHKWQFGGGINWLPFSATRLRLGFLSHDYISESATLITQDRDYLSWDLSCSVTF